ncbi:MAG: carboxypeptidase-like regulatory domain-containing protein [Acidobacteriia bacterium]|nr:carboxypeptidase-like regulatory domain-containing protein [Terriglobia bacterium]
MRKSAIPFFFLVLTGAAFAQSNSGLIAGTVSDPEGAMVSGASVQLKNTATGHSFTTISLAKGNYTLANVPPGTYDLTVSVAGLNPYSRKNVAVTAGQTLPLNIRLEYNTQLNTLGEDRVSAAADAKRHAPPDGPTPRTAEGKPDLSGVWWTPRTVDPGHPHFLPQAEQIAKERTENLRKDTPQARCLPSAATRIGPVYEFVQSKAYLIEISDDDSPGFHQIYLDGRSQPKDPNPAWYGHNVGHWEGDTLVVDRIGFDERVWLDQAGHPHSAKLHITERYRRPDFGHLETDVTVEDPGILAEPYTEKRVSDLAPSEEIYEFICPENNRDVIHMVGK